MWFLPSNSLDFMIYFLLTLSATVCAIYGVYHPPLESLSKKTKQLRMTIASKLSGFNFKTRKKRSVKSQVQKYRRRRCRRYISAKKKGKQQRIGNKSKVKYNFHRIKVTTYEVSSTSASTGGGVKHTSKYKFDPDSYIIGIDNHVSRCISNDINHFITALTPTPRSYLKGIPVGLKVQGEGALVWHIDDDQGRSHKIKIKNCLYVLGLPSCLASPRHWADQVDDHYPRPDGTWCATYAKNCVFQWDRRKFTRTIPMNGNTNTPKLYSTPGCNKYRLTVVELELLAQTSEFEVSKSFSDESLLRLDSDEEDSSPEDCEATDESVLEGDATNEDNIEIITDFLSPNTVPEPDEVDQDVETSALSDKGEFLRWNFCLGHLSYPKMKVLVLLGWLPRNLLKVRPPMCAFCKVGSMTRRPWRVKGKKNRGYLRKVKAPGDCVSVDQLESRTPKFIGAMRGFATKRRYTCAHSKILLGIMVLL